MRQARVADASAARCIFELRDRGRCRGALREDERVEEIEAEARDRRADVAHDPTAGEERGVHDAKHLRGEARVLGDEIGRVA